jgi:hypothetical protein
VGGEQNYREGGIIEAVLDDTSMNTYSDRSQSGYVERSPGASPGGRLQLDDNAQASTETKDRDLHCTRTCCKLRIEQCCYEPGPAWITSWVIR